MKKKKNNNYDFDLIFPVEVFKKNREKMWQEHLKEKKRQEKEIIIGMFLIGAILVGIFYLGYLQNSKAMEKCTQNHDYDYCLVNL